MIRRSVEYIIICDSARVLGEEKCGGDATAFNSETAEDCAAEAKRYGWTQVSKRLWLCPKCSERLKTTKES